MRARVPVSEPISGGVAWQHTDDIGLRNDGANEHHRVRLIRRLRWNRGARPHPAHNRRIRLRRPISAIAGRWAAAWSRRSGSSVIATTNSRAALTRVVQSWDTTNKASALSDSSVCTTWGINGNHVFLLSVFRRRPEYTALKRAVREQQSPFNASEVLIEDEASGTPADPGVDQ